MLLTGFRASDTISFVIEIVSFLLGLGFSLLVFFLSIKPLKASWFKKFVYFVLSFIGIAGTLFLFGILIGHFLRRFGLIKGN